MSHGRSRISKQLRRKVLNRDKKLCGIHLGGCRQPVNSSARMGHIVPVNACRSGYEEATLAETGFISPLMQPALPDALVPSLAKQVWKEMEKLPENLQPMCDDCDHRMKGTYLNPGDIVCRLHVSLDPSIKWPIHELRWRWDDEWRSGALEHWILVRQPNQRGSIDRTPFATLRRIAQQAGIRVTDSLVIRIHVFSWTDLPVRRMMGPLDTVKYLNSEGLTRWLGLYSRNTSLDGMREQSARISGAVVGILQAPSSTKHSSQTQPFGHGTQGLFARGAEYGHDLTWRTICLEYEKEQVFRRCGNLIHPQISKDLPALHLRMGMQQKIISPTGSDFMVMRQFIKNKHVCLCVKHQHQDQLHVVELPLERINI